MSASPSHADTAARLDARAHSRGGDFVTLTKPRLNFLVLLTTAAAYSLGAGPDARLIDLVHTLLGTFLVAGGAAALNQVWERRTDRLMRRTQNRPMADQRMSVPQGTTFGILLTLAGVVELAIFINPLSAGVALFTTLSYLFLYTPLKLRTSLSTIAGALPGALPAVIGWAAATNTLSIEAWVLFGIVFMWQMPHFLAIAWMYRDDYARAGYPMLPVIEPDGGSTGRQAVVYAAALVPLSLAPALMKMTGEVYFAGALVLGLAFLWLTVRFARTRSVPDARRVFFGSIVYLPVLWVLMIANKIS